MTACTTGSPVNNLRIVGCDGGDVFHIHGEDAGAEGVELEYGGLEDLFEPPIKVVERTPVRMDGGVLRAVKTAIMEATIALIIKGQDLVNPFGVVDGAIREAFSFELDPYYDQSSLARIEWETDQSTRWLEVVLTEGCKYQMTKVPHDRGDQDWWVWDVKLKAYCPFWQQGVDITPLTFTEDGTQQIEISNPTGVDMAHKWVGTQATWTLPDNTWEGRAWNRAPGGLYPDRTLTYPDLTPANGGIKVDYAFDKLPVRDGFDHNLAGQMPVPGDFPKHQIPRFTQPQLVDVTATNVPPGGAMIQLHQPRMFRRAWGRV